MSGHRVTRQRFGSVGSLSGSAARAVGIDESRGAERAPAAARMVMAAVSLPTQRTSPKVPAASLATTTVLVADPGRPRRTTLAAGLLAMGIGRVLQAASVADMDELLAHRHGGDVALVSLAFHLDRERLIPDLLEVGWLRVIVLAGTPDPGRSSPRSGPAPPECSVPAPVSAIDSRSARRLVGYGCVIAVDG